MAAEDGLMVVASNAPRDLVSRDNEVEHSRRNSEGLSQAKKHEEERRERDRDRSRNRKMKKRRKRRRRDDRDGDERRSRKHSDDSEDDDSDEDRKRRRRKEKKRERKQDSSSSSSRDRKKSGRRKQRHRLGSNRSRSRSLSRSDDSDERRGRRRRRRNNEVASDTKTESQALVVVEKDTAQSKMDAATSNHQEQTEKRLPRPSTSRSFASVCKTVVQVRPQSPTSEPLMIEDGRVEDDGAKERPLVDEMEGSTSNQPVDMIQAYRNYVLNSTIWGTDEKKKERRRLFLPFDFEEINTEESELNQKYVERQKRLNEMVRSDPTDEDAWMALANLHQPLQQSSSRAVAAHSKRPSLDSNREIAGLKRKREILTRATKHNVDSFDLRVELITTLERLCLLSEVDEKVVAEESDNAIRLFEVLAAEEVRDKISPHIGRTRVHNLVNLHRMRWRRLTCNKSSRFNANRIRDCFIEALSSVSKVQGREPIGPESSVIFLDYLRMEALMGYSERAVAMIQAILEMNVHRDNKHQATGGDNAWPASFFDYWNSEAPRIGDAYPCAGWLGWENGTRNDKAMVHSKPPNCSERDEAKDLSKKMKRRMKASDFFSGGADADVEDASESKVQQVNGEDTRSQTTENRKNKLVGAYETAASQLEGPSAPTQSVENVDRIFSVARSAIQKQQEQQRFLEQIDAGEEDDGKAGANSSTSINVEAFTAQAGEVVPSQIQDDKASVFQVYSFLHHRRIEVSKEELSGEATKDSLQRALKRLRQKKKDAKDHSARQFNSSNDTTKLYMISEDDGFLQWSTEEAKTQDLFSPPLRSTQEPELAYYDHNRSIWVEDGIQWIAAPFLSNFDDGCGLPALVSVCLEFLGVTFPRSLLSDSYAKDAYVLSSTTNGGERISDIGCIQGALTGVFEVFTTEGRSYSWSDVYHQLLADESIVLFDERIFQSGQEKEMGFVRNVLHDIVSRTEPNGAAYAGSSGPRWTSYVQIALILYESRAAGNKAAEVARGILAGTEAAKNDPRLWMAYAQLEFRQKCSKESVDKAYKAKTKILLSALGAGGSGAFHCDHSPWWIELAVASVRSMLHLPINSEMDASLFNIVPIDQHLRNRLLHVICCAIEGKFVALPKKQKGKSKENETATLVDDARLRKCRLHLELIIQKGICHDAEVLITPPPSAEMFDSTPKLYHLAILAAWLNALDSQKCDSDELDFDSGISTLNEWASKLVALKRKNGQASSTCLVRLVHAQLEFALLQFASCSPGVSQDWTTANSIMTRTLVPSIILLKSNGLVPSRPLLLAAAYAESKLQATASQIVRGYEFLLCPFLNYKLHSNEVIYIVAKAIFVARADKTCVAEKKKDADGTLTHDAECCSWTRDGRKMVEKSLLSAIDKAGYCCYPTLWSALLRLKLLGSLSSTRKPASAFGEAKSFYHENIIARCSYSKRLWLDAFSLLRPTYSDVEMIVSTEYRTDVLYLFVVNAGSTRADADTRWK